MMIEGVKKEKVNVESKKESILRDLQALRINTNTAKNRIHGCK